MELLRFRPPARAVAGAGAACGAAGLWIAARLGSEDDSANAARETAAVARLPSIEAAQALDVVRFERLLSPEEVESVCSTADSLKPKLGRSGRDQHGNLLLGHAPWETWYLHTGRAFPSECQWLRDKLWAAAAEADRTARWGLLAEAPPGAVNFRTVELHQVTAGGGLPDLDHFDGGSLVTLDLMLADPEGGDFSGGLFQTLEAGGALRQHTFHRGDVLVFPSHKKHCVAPVSAGRRLVLVAELWEGDERSCAHRCAKRFGPCSFSAAAALVDRMIKGGGAPDVY